MANLSRSTPTTSAPETSRGKTVINDSVVAKIAGLAAREASGVHALGGGAARAFGAIREAVAGSDPSQGISVEVGDTQVAVDAVIVAEYPAPLQDVAAGVRSNIVRAIETIVGLEASEVNVTVNDVHLPSDDDNDDDKSNAEARAQ